MEKHRDMEGEGEKAMDTNMDGSPGYLSQSSPGSLETHPVRKRLNIGLQLAVGLGLYNTIQYNTKQVLACTKMQLVVKGLKV